MHSGTQLYILVFSRLWSYYKHFFSASPRSSIDENYALAKLHTPKVRVIYCITHERFVCVCVYGFIQFNHTCIWDRIYKIVHVVDYSDERGKQRIDSKSQ